MGRRIAVLVSSRDPVIKAGIESQLRARPEIWLTNEASAGECVTVVAGEEVDEELLLAIRRACRTEASRVVVVVSRPEEAGLVSAVEAGARAILRRTDASAEALVDAVRGAASGDGSVPPDLLGRLLDQVGKLQREVLAPRGLLFNGLAEREVEVLKLAADGFDTAEIADRLAYSERTIKNVFHNVTVRLGLRNRTHAVAYAVREGLI